MKIILESTNKIVYVDGTPCRLWEGKTEGGVPMQAFIARVSLQGDLDSSEFDRELAESPPPSVFRDVASLRFA